MALYAHPVFDKIIQQEGIKNDAALARSLGVAPPVICKIRSGALPIGPTMMISIHENFLWSIREIKEAIAAHEAAKNPPLIPGVSA